jgi:hypothetical protein
MNNLPITNIIEWGNYMYDIRDVEVFAYLSFFDKTNHFHRTNLSREGVCITWIGDPFKVRNKYRYFFK